MIKRGHLSHLSSLKILITGNLKHFCDKIVKFSIWCHLFAFNIQIGYCNVSIYQYPWTEDNFLEIRFLIVPVWAPTVWEGRGRFTNVLAGDKAVIWPELMPPLGQMGPTPSFVIILPLLLLASIETLHYSVNNDTLIQTHTDSGLLTLAWLLWKCSTINNHVYLCLHLLSDCHRHFCLNVLTKTIFIAHRFSF